MSWNPHVTVATIIHRDGRYLMVKEHAENGIALNQPAGHLESNETLTQAARREALEETGWDVEIVALLGVSRFVAPANGETYVRFSFIGEAIAEIPDAQLDDGIISAQWLTKEEIKATENGGVPSPRLRSPLVLKDIERFEQGEKLPLSVIYEHPFAP